MLGRWNKKLENAFRRDPEVEQPLKQFTPKNKNLEVLEDYTKVLGKEYWDQWKKHEYVVTPGSIIDHEKLAEIAERLELKEQEKVEEIAGMLEHGRIWGLKGKEGGPQRERITRRSMSLGRGLPTRSKLQ